MAFFSRIPPASSVVRAFHHLKGRTHRVQNVSLAYDDFSCTLPYNNNSFNPKTSCFVPNLNLDPFLKVSINFDTGRLSLWYV
jgi:hypothetical protein